MALISGCVSEDDGGPAATGGSSGSGGSGTSGSTATGGGGGSSTGGVSGGDPLAIACPTPTAALITDFSTPSDTTNTGVSFGDALTMFSGATFIYPSGTANFPLKSDVSAMNWHVTGDVGDYSGLGIAHYVLVTDPTTTAMVSTPCTKFDASAFKGISFKISGSLPGASGTVNNVTFLVGTAANDINSAWLNAHKANPTDADVHNFGRCTPASDNRYDGSCGAPSKVIPVTATPTVQNVLWADLLGGKPSATVDPKELVSMVWVLPNPTGAGTATPTTYPGDLVIDDLKFIE